MTETLINRIMQSKWVPGFVRWRYWQTRDPDNLPLTDEQLKKMKRRYDPDADVFAKAARRVYGDKNEDR